MVFQTFSADKTLKNEHKQNVFEKMRIRYVYEQLLPIAGFFPGGTGGPSHPSLPSLNTFFCQIWLLKSSKVP